MFVAPYDDPYTIAGQGTIGTEILRQVQNLDYPIALHAVLCEFDWHSCTAHGAAKD